MFENAMAKLKKDWTGLDELAESTLVASVLFSVFEKHFIFKNRG